MSCPNINSPEYKKLVSKIGVFETFKLWIANGEDFPKDIDSIPETFRGINATLKIITALQKTPRTHYPSNSIQGFYNDLVKQGAPKNQIELLQQYIKDHNITDINTNDLIVGLLSEMSYTVEINTAKSNIDSAEVDNELDSLYIPKLSETYYFSYKDGWFKEDKNQDRIIASQEELKIIEEYKSKNATQNSSFYSNMTVPGGTNYTENEIATPQIIPSIKGHAQFSTENGIGWTRTDDRNVELDLLINQLEDSGQIKRIDC